VEFIYFFWISVVFEFGGPFVAKKQKPGIAGDLPVERLVRLFELKTWREMYTILLDFSCF
jgi:hypothetical protein